MGQDGLNDLKKAFQKGQLTLYLGAGVSKDNGLPSWDELVQALYFSTLTDEQVINELHPFPNYLFALAEWVLKQKNEPLDIITRKIKYWYSGPVFIEKMRNVLYAGFNRQDWGSNTAGLPKEIITKNKTLEAIAECCRKSSPNISGLCAVITYNYDNLLELGLDNYPGLAKNFEVVYSKQRIVDATKIPIYHVHGYIPYQDMPVNYEDIIFSEDQYNKTFQDPYFWGNMVQVKQLTRTTGLMIGMSLADRNTRRILDSLRNQPFPSNNYILLRKPKFKNIGNPSRELDEIRDKAQKYLDRFAESRMKMPDKEPFQIQQLLSKIYEYEREEFAKGFEDLGIKLITFDEFDEIPGLLKEIASV